MEPLVSILIPAYNAEKWISETIESALAQSWKRKEIIVVDDGSKDGTLDVARMFEWRGVKVVAQDNQGAAAARNKAWSVCNGDYVQWLDADDLLSPDKIESQILRTEGKRGPRTLLSGGWGHFIYRPHRARFTANDLWCDLTPAEFLMRKLERRVFMQTAVWLVSRELTAAAGPWDTTMISDDDGEYFCRVLLCADGVKYIPEARVYYRIAGAGSLSYVGLSDKKLEALWGSMKLHLKYLQSLDSGERARRASRSYLQSYLPVFHEVRPDIVDQMKAAAADLGGDLHAPNLPWKYAWIESIAGWKVARRAQLMLPEVKWRVICQIDQFALQFEKAVLRRG